MNTQTITKLTQLCKEELIKSNKLGKKEDTSTLSSVYTDIEKKESSITNGIYAIKFNSDLTESLTYSLTEKKLIPLPFALIPVTFNHTTICQAIEGQTIKHNLNESKNVNLLDYVNLNSLAMVLNMIEGSKESFKYEMTLNATGLHFKPREATLNLDLLPTLTIPLIKAYNESSITVRFNFQYLIDMIELTAAINLNQPVVGLEIRIAENVPLIIYSCRSSAVLMHYRNVRQLAQEAEAEKINQIAHTI